MGYCVYILLTSSNTLYIGQTKDLDKRMRLHERKSPKSAKYLRYFDSFKLVYVEQVGSRSDALKREAALKRLTREKKNELIRGYQFSL